MLTLINSFLRSCIRRFFNSIKDDCINNIIGFGMVSLIAIISISVSALIDNNKIAFGIIALIVTLILLPILFYKGK
ncbi:hypothetical protein FJMB80055_29250 [Enterobacter hormaechei]|uniref:Uncharacterized protein n=5 Tax=Enterobacter hormaechei TaxID=158836 RepID=A0A855VRN5_9ENTR|nr:hypothetical protein AM429_10325 [Enterobacter cloacae complex sp.]AVU19213.1 hypothetical protein AO413_06175 [Enterobacter cloacae]KJM79539.1 hypothetical protein SS12_15225 [Enterobacter hormaechei subsp. hoffmannii]PTX87713.1 hypothetical protein C1O12_04625 [Enterobacter hormaechei]KJN14687.1 hypothetical protein SS58_14775 [Enterobacter hormaechei subsp. hoffmannii]